MASADPSSNIEDISMNSFLDFLKVTCQVNDSIDNKEKASVAEIDYNKLAKNEIVNNLLLSKQPTNSRIENNEIVKDSAKLCSDKRWSNSTSVAENCPQKSKGDTNIKDIHPLLSKKLEEVIKEGILDSVLPYICPSNPTNISGHATNASIKGNKSIKLQEQNLTLPPAILQEQEKKEPVHNESNIVTRSPRLNSGGGMRGKELRTWSRRKSTCYSHATVDDVRGDAEVIIHVCDEMKNTSKDFSCPQLLLVSKMGYFADVTAGQKLEDMDISVHCDIQIFDWLMKWVKRDSSQTDLWPHLDASNVVPILVSASFLQMEPLLLDCLSFCHSRLNEVVRASSNLSCLNDCIITRLAAMFTNLELESIKDKKERVTPRLWTKMIQSLFEMEPQALRGHYFSLAGLFRCNRCGKYMTQSVSSYMCCTPTNTRLNRWGQVISQHSRDASWQITNYVAALFKEMKSWRKVYWKLWGHCHFLYCCICESHFPAYQMNWCQYHKEQPQFLGPITEGRIAGPAGRYPCCGQQAFRFETLPGPNGCEFREHSVLIESDRDRAILALTQIAAEGNCLYENPPPKPQNHGQTEPRWVGMSLMPTKCRQGLLPMLHAEEFNGKLPRRLRKIAHAAESSSETESSETNDKSYIPRKFSTSSDGCESEVNSPRQYIRKSRKRQTKASIGRYWCGEISARSNQDNQREFEEKVMKQVAAMVSKKTGSDTSIHYNNFQNGGAYVKLEADWREQVRQKNFNKQKLK